MYENTEASSFNARLANPRQSYVAEHYSPIPHAEFRCALLGVAVDDDLRAARRTEWLMERTYEREIERTIQFVDITVSTMIVQGSQ